MTSRVRVIAIGSWCTFLVAAGTMWRWFAGAPSVPELAMGVIVTGVGLVLIARVPGNVVSWLVMAVGVGWSWMYLGNALTIAQWRDLFPEAVVVGFVWIGHWMWLPAMVALVFAILVFPDGRLVSPKWRWVLWLGIVGTTIAAVGAAFGPFQSDPRFLEPADRAEAVAEGSTMANPVELANSDLLLLGGGFLVVVFAGATLLSLVVRYRRAGVHHRAQIRWVAFAAALALATYLFGGVIDANTPITWDVLTLVIVAAIPTAIAIAITKYRLYDIDRIVSRTVTYAIVVGLLAVVFAAGAVWVPQQLLAGSSNLAIAASTLAVAALFNPVRRRVQRGVDRRFNRLPYDPEGIAGELATTIRQETHVPSVAGAWQGAVRAALEPSSSSIWLRETDK